MKQKLLLKTMLLLCILVGGASSAWADDYERITSTEDLVVGEKYILVCESKGKAMGAIATYGASVSASITSNTITASSDMNILTLGGSSGAWTFYTSKESKYISWSSGNSLAVSSSASTNAEKWTIAFSSNNALIANKGTTDRKLRYNASSPRFACYTSDQTAIQIYKKKSIIVTALAVKKAPTKLNYKVGETLSLTGLVLDATVGENHVDVTSGYTSSPANGATLSEAGNKTVTLSYGGQSVNQTIYVGSLTGISVKTAPTKTTYDEGQSFDPAGMVLTATYDTGAGHTWTEDVTTGYTYSPTTALTTENTSVTISYGGQSANQTITVNAGVPYTVTFNAGTGSCGTSSLTEASFGAGVTLPTATIGVTGWSFAGWATASTTNTEDEPTLYAASSTYNPTDNVTLYAVYKFSDASTYKRATSVSDITSASSVVIVSNYSSKVLDTTLGTVTAPIESSSKITAPEKAIFTLTGDNTDGYTLTNGTTTIGTTSTNNSTEISNTTTNDLWKVKASGTSNCFYFENTGKSNLCLEYYSSSWMVYAPSTPSSNSNVAMKVYVPVSVYNSNPAAIVNPTIAFTTAGNKSLYVKDDATYDNAANVTGIAKTPVYTSSDATVATVSDAGVVTALKAGETTITAKVAKEAGVNSEASTSYTVTVKDAKTIAGLKAITSSSSVVTFTADLTDAVVTYVKGEYAFIQDASGAVYASCGSSLTAGDKINGAVTGSIKAANAIDEITAITLTAATVTDDGVIPSAEVMTAAELVANKADLEGKLVSIEGATVTASLTSGSASGGKISDDGKTTEINLYAPDSNIEALKDAEGTFNGYITLYSGSTIRFNIFEQTQITLTKNAPTDQTLTFASDAVELDEETPAYTAFTGQTVSGAQGAVTYSIDSDDDDVVTSINAETGAVVLSGNYGTATIKAAAAAKEVTEAGVTTPYKATTKSYTITVYPRYTSTFNVDGVVTVARQANHSASITIPTPAATIGNYHFMGWKATSAIATPTDDAPEMATPPTTPTSDETYYAVYALQTVGADEDVELYNNTGSTGTHATSGITASGNINANNGSPSGGNCFGLTSSTNNTATFTNINLSSVKSASLTFDYKLAKSGSYYSSLTVTQFDKENAVLGSATNITGSDQTYHTTSAISLDKACVKITIVCTPASSTYNTYVDNVTINVVQSGIGYEDYRTSLPIVEVSIGATGYATYCSPHPLDFSATNVKAYVAASDGSKVTLTEIEDGIVPANAGVVLYCETANTYSIPVTASDATDYAGLTNELIGIIVRTKVAYDGEGSKKNYILANEAAGIGFYKADATGAYLPANRAYLSTENVSTARYMGFELDDETTGISTMHNSQCIMHNDVFDLQGRKIAQPKKGLYIKNGKKVFVK